MTAPTPAERLVVVLGPPSPATTAALVEAGLSPLVANPHGTVWGQPPAPAPAVTAVAPGGQPPGQVLYTIDRAARIPATDIDRLAATTA